MSDTSKTYVSLRRLTEYDDLIKTNIDKKLNTSGGTITGDLNVSNININGYEKFGTYYVKKALGSLALGAKYADLDSKYKDGTYHRVWKLRFPAGCNFWGKLKITLYGTYSSWNASGVLTKSITCNFNNTNIYNNVGFYDGLGLNVETDFRISEALWNSAAGAWEIYIFQNRLAGNNIPTVYLEAWIKDAIYIDSFLGIEAQPVELVQDTTYTALKAAADGTSKTVTWATTPVFETPLGLEVADKPWANATFLGKSAKAADSSKLNGQDSSYYLNYNNFTNIPTIGNGKITIKQNGTEKGSFTLNQTGDVTLELTDNNDVYSLPAASSGIRGGIKINTNQFNLTNTDILGINDNSHKHTITNVTGLQDVLDAKSDNEHTHNYIPTADKGVANGIATLDENGRVLSSQLPSYVDDVLEYETFNNFPTEETLTSSGPETGKIYVALDTNKCYRWGGTGYVEISSSLALGETSESAYYGDKGKIAYDHSQKKGSGAVADKNPHGLTPGDINAAKAAHTHTASEIMAGSEQLSTNIIPIIPIEKGGTGATTAANALINLGLTATATEINYTKGVTSSIQTQLNSKTKSVKNSGISVLEETKSTETVGENQLYLPKGVIIGGSAVSAGLVTRGICGITTPTDSGTCKKDHLFLNYDGNVNYERKVVLGASTPGDEYLTADGEASGVFKYAAVRGDALKTYVDAAVAPKYDSKINRPKKTILAAPVEHNGPATFRELVAEDLPAVDRITDELKEEIINAVIERLQGVVISAYDE